jgi:Uma2 family endonuclease
MATLSIELPSQKSQTAFNLRRWEEVLADPDLAKVEGRVETDRHGQIVMSPPPGANHAGYQFQIARELNILLPNGRTSTECPISTADGVRAADVAWASPECLRHLGNRTIYPVAPEICVEVFSPRNTRREIDERKSLFLDAGAKEVWVCSLTGAMTFHKSDGQIPTSPLCPSFPKKIKLFGA